MWLCRRRAIGVAFFIFVFCAGGNGIEFPGGTKLH